MHTWLLPFTARYICLTLAAAGALAFLIGLAVNPGVWWLPGFGVFAGLSVLGIHDLLQTRHAVLRSFPISAHLRFILEKMRPEMRQYFFEDEKRGSPFSRDRRAVVYQRAKSVLDKLPRDNQGENPRQSG
jgi:hypothetical protein